MLWNSRTKHQPSDFKSILRHLGLLHRQWATNCISLNQLQDLKECCFLPSSQTPRAKLAFCHISMDLCIFFPFRRNIRNTLTFSLDSLWLSFMLQCRLVWAATALLQWLGERFSYSKRKKKGKGGSVLAYSYLWTSGADLYHSWEELPCQDLCTLYFGHK